MLLLIDTNILIPLEDTAKELPQEFADFRRICSDLGYQIFIHPEQASDINRDKNQTRREIVLSRIRQYPQIPNPPTVSDAELQANGWNQNKDNDRVDNLLLQALNRGAVHFLITNDAGIHKKAKKINCHESVFRFEQILSFLKGKLKPESQVPSGLKERFLYEFDVNMPFFDSLRNGYQGFNKWYLKCAKSQRKAWCISQTECTEPQAMCIYKEEENVSIVDNGDILPGKILKLSTLKVSEEVRGRKLGERLLFAAFKYADEHKINWVYLHTYGKEHELLVGLCEEYGFVYAGEYGKDQVYLKQMTPQEDAGSSQTPLEFSVKYYPHFMQNESVNKYLIPIKSDYHNQLFADISDITNSFFADDPSMYKAPANTIKKVYLCHAKIKKIKAGDVLLFYRTGDRKSIEAIGIVEKTLRTQDFNTLSKIVAKRTVFNDSEIHKMLEKEVLVLLFRLQKYIQPISGTLLEKVGLKGPYQSIRVVDQKVYNEVFCGQ